MEKVKILIADDIQEIAKRIKAIIEKNEKVEVIGIANDGQEEYEQILELNPDLVFTDNKMPKLNGIDVIEKIRNEYTEQIKTDFVIITSDRSGDLYSKLCKLRIYSIVNKPFEDVKIIQIIEEYIIEKEKQIEKKQQERLPIEIKEKKSLWRKILYFLGLIKIEKK